MPTGVYNPRENTFIKAPEVSTCPTCGQMITKSEPPMNTHMNNYISATGTIMTINSNEDVITVKDVPMYRCDQTDKKTGLLHKSSFLPKQPVKQEQQTGNQGSVNKLQAAQQSPQNPPQNIPQQQAQTTQTNP